MNTIRQESEGDNTLVVSRLDELHALLDDFHQEQRAAKPAAPEGLVGNP